MKNHFVKWLVFVVAVVLVFIVAAVWFLAKPCPKEIPETVRIPERDYRMGKFEVTNFQYWTIMGDQNRLETLKEFYDFPITEICWYDAIIFCKKLTDYARERGFISQKQEFRLPTSEEWEHACASGSKALFYTGNSEAALDRAAWWSKNSGDRTHPVGQKIESLWGLHDMLGNVWEFTTTISKSNNNMIWICGGSFSENSENNYAFFDRSRSRVSRARDEKKANTGFRVVLAPVPAEKVKLEKALKKQMPKQDEISTTFPQMIKVPDIDYLSMGKFEVTQEQFEFIMGTNPSKNKGAKNLPVDSVTWHAAVDYCNKLTARAREQGIITEKQRFRLPTTKEWLHTAYAGTPTRYAGGNTFVDYCDYGWHRYNADDRSHPVGTKFPNAWGFHDFGGNVWEWCAMDGNPRAHTRGGGYWGVENHILTWVRWETKTYTFSDFGFRVALVDNELEEIAIRKAVIPEVVEIPGENFKMGKYEISWFQRGMTPENALFGDHFLTFYGGDWYQAVDYCKRLTEYARERGIIEQTEEFRLPTNDEFTKACKHNADDHSKDGWNKYNAQWVTHFIGEAYIDESGVVHGGPNAYGIWDMHGNVWEWTQERFVRGGSWKGNPVNCDYHQWTNPNTKWDDLGFRVVLAPVPAERLAAEEAEKKAIARKMSIVPEVVEIPGRNYSMGKYEVTNFQYWTLVNTQDARERLKNSKREYNFPAVYITWQTSVDYCKKLTDYARERGFISQKQEFRLPTSEEWEFACRAGTTTKYNTGNNESDLARAAWYKNNSENRCHPVGLKVANAWGIHDMHGNVWERTSDFNDVRGAAYGHDAARLATALGSHPDNSFDRNKKAYDIGFRVVLAPFPSPKKLLQKQAFPQSHKQLLKKRRKRVLPRKK